LALPENAKICTARRNSEILEEKCTLEVDERNVLVSEPVKKRKGGTEVSSGGVCGFQVVLILLP
jgi:hypothetical protein